MGSGDQHVLMGGKGPPRISETTGPISQTQTLCDVPGHNKSDKLKKIDLKVTDDVTGRVTRKFSTFWA